MAEKAKPYRESLGAMAGMSGRKFDKAKHVLVEFDRGALPIGVLFENNAIKADLAYRARSLTLENQNTIIRQVEAAPENERWRLARTLIYRALRET